MKETEFLTRLNDEVNRWNVADAADIVEEYAQHFNLKLADGYFEEEIAARLGDPAMLAAQFGEDRDAPQRRPGSKALTVIGLVLADVFAGLFFLLLAGFAVVLAAAALAYVVCALSTGSFQFWHVWGCSDTAGNKTVRQKPVGHTVSHRNKSAPNQAQSAQHAHKQRKPRKPCDHKVSGVWRGRRDLNPRAAFDGLLP